ncbi:hypothetical protein ARNL5_02903 [Anaerolineae bacterium]|nr:hypothetical protein ARNL5_02903 [Anaerolineae bacterium]
MGPRLSGPEPSGPEPSEGDRAAHARARARAYSLFARLMGEGPSPRWLGAAALEARMCEAIESYADRDSLAADHEHVLGNTCFASLYLDPEARLGGETSDRAREALSRAGILEGPSGEEPEHLATQLHALALLSGAEADALEDCESEIALRMRAASRHVLDALVLRYAPILADAARRSGRAWPAACADALEGLLLQHRSTLGAPEPSDADFALPPLALSLDEAQTDLSAISGALTRPARAGFFVSRDDLALLGRKTSTPRGFGDRATELENLLRGAAELGSWVALIDGLDAQALESASNIASLSDVPEALRAPWRSRIEATRAILARLRDALPDAPGGAEGDAR